MQFKNGGKQREEKGIRKQFHNPFVQVFSINKNVPASDLKFLLLVAVGFGKPFFSFSSLQLIVGSAALSIIRSSLIRTAAKPPRKNDTTVPLAIRVPVPSTGGTKAAGNVVASSSAMIAAFHNAVEENADDDDDDDDDP